MSTDKYCLYGIKNEVGGFVTSHLDDCPEGKVFWMTPVKGCEIAMECIGDGVALKVSLPNEDVSGGKRFVCDSKDDSDGLISMAGNVAEYILDSVGCDSEADAVADMDSDIEGSVYEAVADAINTNDQGARQIADDMFAVVSKMDDKFPEGVVGYRLTLESSDGEITPDTGIVFHVFADSIGDGQVVASDGYRIGMISDFSGERCMADFLELFHHTEVGNPDGTTDDVFTIEDDGNPDGGDNGVYTVEKGSGGGDVDVD